MRSSAKRPEGRPGASAGTAAPEGGPTTLAVKVMPGAPRDTLSWDGPRGWVARVTAPPVDGKANAHLCAFLAREVLHLPVRAVRVRSGGQSRHKLLEIDLDAAELEARLAPLSGSP